MFSTGTGLIVLQALVLILACLDDLRSKKIHNYLILFMLPFVLLGVFFLGGIGLLKAGVLSAGLALFLGVPLALLRIIGGGDLKLMVLFSLTLMWPDFLTIIIYAFPWALLFGIFKIILDKKLKEFLFNMFFLVKHRKTEGMELNSIPFSIALFMAWLSFLTLETL